jgi:lysophospholipase L1-like esterase
MGNFLTLQVANGNAYFVGLAVVVVASFCRFVTEKKNWRLGARISAVIGATLIMASATPLSIAVYAAWLILFGLTFALPMRLRCTLTGATCTLALLSTVMWLNELRYRQTPVIPVRRDQTIYVIGDSISAGIRSEKEPWPELLHHYKLQVVNLAQAGATVESAFQQAQRIENTNSVAIVEIGGNDFFGPTKSSEFSEHLDRLLALLARQRQTIAMFELPLLPFHNAFGSAQRTLAAKYHAVLLPKTYLARVLGLPHATIDGLHLSHSGHESMAQSVYQTLKREPSPP